MKKNTVPKVDVHFRIPASIYSKFKATVALKGRSMTRIISRHMAEYTDEYIREKQNTQQE